MIEQSILNKLELAGYYLLPPPHRSSPGHNGLMVLLHQKPTETIFDPEAIHLKIRNWDKTVHWTTFETETPFPSARSVCPGKVVVYDRSGEEASFFVFGGTLEGTLMPGETFYSLHSGAPVLSLTGQEHSVDSQLAIDVEGILAAEQAQQRWRDQTFWRYLITIDPFQLYMTCLDMILNYHKQSPTLRHAHYYYYHALEKEKEWLVQAQKWPQIVPTLEELLRASPNI